MGIDIAEDDEYIYSCRCRLSPPPKKRFVLFKINFSRALMQNPIGNTSVVICRLTSIHLGG